MSKFSIRSRAVWLFVIPALLFQLVWGWYPLIVSVILSFTDARVRGPLNFAGLTSYRRILNDPLFHKALAVTLSYTALTLILTFVIPILVAVLLMEMPRRTLRTMMLLWFLPISGIANAVLWRYFYNTEYGLMQKIVTSIGLEPQQFLNNPDRVLFWLVFPAILLFGPGLIYLAALQSVPSSYYEAAEVEGASMWRKLWTITLPHLQPIISLMLIFALINTLQTFYWPFIITGGGPAGSSRTVAIYIYDLWKNLRFADATAAAIYLFAITMAFVGIVRYANVLVNIVRYLFRNIIRLFRER